MELQEETELMSGHRKDWESSGVGLAVILGSIKTEGNIVAASRQLSNGEL